MIASLALTIAVMVATVILLGLGMAVGYHLGSRRRTSEASLTFVTHASDPLPQHNVSFESADLMRAYAIAALEATSRYRATVPAELIEAIDKLVTIAQRVSEQLSGNPLMKTAPPTASTKPDPKPISPLIGLGQREPEASHNASRLSAMEMEELASADGFAANDSDRRRYSYHSYQRVFPLEEPGALPSIGLARTVRCHDISVHGISFFWHDDPDFDRLVISLGPDSNPIWMLAEIMQSKAVYMHDEIKTLVGCRFIGRYAWQHAPATDHFTNNCQAQEFVASD